jgi:hypothetical protein
MAYLYDIEAAHAERDDVVVLEVKVAAALHALPFVALPHGLANVATDGSPPAGLPGPGQFAMRSSCAPFTRRLCIASAVAASAGNVNSIDSSEVVTSVAVPKVATVAKNDSSSPSGERSRISGVMM